MKKIILLKELKNLLLEQENLNEHKRCDLMAELDAAIENEQNNNWISPKKLLSLVGSVLSVLPSIITLIDKLKH